MCLVRFRGSAGCDLERLEGQACEALCGVTVAAAVEAVVLVERRPEEARTGDPDRELVLGEEVVVVLPTDTLAPTEAPTETPVPTDLPTETPTDLPIAAPPILGGADKLAFVQNRDIWMINLDGTDLVRLTTDGSFKTNLQWTPDARFLFYLTGSCIRSVTAEGVADNIACFSFAEIVGGFAISPDGTQLAVSLDNQMYVLPLDRSLLAPGELNNRNDVIELAQTVCPSLAPYQRNFVRQMLWSKDGLRMALKIIAPGSGSLLGTNTDNITIVEIGDCSRAPDAKDNFPVPRFEIQDFDERPEFTDWSWDGNNLYTVTSHSPLRTNFGDLYLYNGLQFQGRKINPIEGNCCYREVRWSPDGQFILFVYQEFAANSQTQIYYVFFNDLLSGVTLTPLPLPEFTDTREFPQPALRPAVSP
ncbi:MAG: PD40 domain-containing protein [Anaerolineales bacterium]|nr:PD40 domain-containing protein [Anaerolineales bacterium]